MDTLLEWAFNRLPGIKFLMFSWLVGSISSTGIISGNESGRCVNVAWVRIWKEAVGPLEGVSSVVA